MAKKKSKSKPKKVAAKSTKKSTAKKKSTSAKSTRAAGPAKKKTKPVARKSPPKAGKKKAPARKKPSLETAIASPSAPMETAMEESGPLDVTAPESAEPMSEEPAAPDNGSEAAEGEFNDTEEEDEAPESPS